MADLGENYQYVKTMLDNKIELAKLDVAQLMGKMLGKALLYSIAMSVGSLLASGLLIALALYLGQVFDSIIQGVLAVCGILVLLCILLFVFRRTLIFKPAAHILYSLIDDEDE